MITPDGMFRRDFEWQRKFEKAIMRRVGPHLLSAAPMRIDKTEATDFMMFDASDRRIAARIRRPSTRRVFWRDITLRSWRASGARTEWAKIIEDGFAHWMFYGRHTGVARDLDPWFLVDLGVLRQLFADFGYSILFERDKMNPDGKTAFHVLRPGDIVRTFARPELLIDWYWEGQRGQGDLFKGAA